MSDRDLIQSEDSPIVVSAAPVPLTVDYAPRRLTVHHVSGTELDTIASLGNSLHLTFFGWCGGAAVAFAIVLTTVAITDPTTHAGYVAALIVSSVLAIYFGIRGVIDYMAAKKKLREIKSGR
jgi:hypothetical protein